MPSSVPFSDSVDSLVSDAKRAAKDLAAVTSQISKRLVSRADQVAKDPTGSARKAARKAADELDKARKEIEKALEHL